MSGVGVACVPITRCNFTNRCCFFCFRWNFLNSKIITKIQTKTQWLGGGVRKESDFFATFPITNLLNSSCWKLSWNFYYVSQRLQEQLFNMFASWVILSRDSGEGILKSRRELDGLLFFVLFCFCSLLYNYIKVNFTGNILFF